MYQELKETFRNRKVLVTGHTGFKGSWLCQWLLELNADITGYALDPYTDADNFVQTGLSSRIKDIRADVRDFDKLKSVMQEVKPEFVFHLAAQPLVLESYARPKDTLDINIGGSINVMEACRETESVRVMVMITSDKCYENKEWVWGYRENDPMGGFDPYSASKGAAEIVIAAYRNSFYNPSKFKLHGKALSSVRAGNVIGGGDWARDRIVPDCIKSLISGKSIEVRNPYSTRPWQHVLEPLGGYLHLAEMMYHDPIHYAGAWNFGPDLSSIREVQDLVELIIEEWGSGQYHVSQQVEKPHEAKLLALDISKVRLNLGWKPTWDFEQTIKQTVAWYKGYCNKEEMAKLCQNQIKAFMS
ncbi:MAG TPA: CDP-glucose 4,6-dehydratase [Candidatus Cloacimonadota bacterium]|nr:CDP-glucose 4,6-dehydratase [Candidatus Cloacimonadota bacterium]